jgi:hypothetical protein
VNLFPRAWRGYSSKADAAAAIVKTLIDAGGNTVFRTDAWCGGRKALHIAAVYGNPTVLGVLLEDGADAAITDASLGRCTTLKVHVRDYTDALGRTKIERPRPFMVNEKCPTVTAAVFAADSQA